jgi:hypothetical protein
MTVMGEDEPSRFELLRFSYGEVLDATKHQDDKVGRLLGAVAFLTGGALVFANKDVLQVDVLIAGRSYPLGAVSLAAFILIDLVAVASYLMAMAAPLTMPRESRPLGSHIYFRDIAAQEDTQWKSRWVPGGLDSFDEELLGEIRNIADRADRKYSRTATATNLFLAALVVLAPTLVVGLAAAGRDPADGPLPWDAAIRWCVAISVAVIVGSLLAPLAFNAREPGIIGRRTPLWCLLVTYLAMLASMIVADPSGSIFYGGAWAIVVFGLASVGFAIWTYSASTLRWVLHAGTILAVTASGFVSWCFDRSDLQLFVALGGGVLVVLPNIIEELTHRSRIASAGVMT